MELFPTTNKKKSFHIKVKLGQRQNKAIYPELFTVTAEEEKREFKLINVNKRNPMFVKALRRDWTGAPQWNIHVLASIFNIFLILMEAI